MIVVVVLFHNVNNVVDVFSHLLLILVIVLVEILLVVCLGLFLFFFDLNVWLLVEIITTVLGLVVHIRLLILKHLSRFLDFLVHLTIGELIVQLIAIIFEFIFFNFGNIEVFIIIIVEVEVKGVLSVSFKIRVIDDALDFVLFVVTQVILVFILFNGHTVHLDLAVVLNLLLLLLNKLLLLELLLLLVFSSCKLSLLLLSQIFVTFFQLEVILNIENLLDI